MRVIKFAPILMVVLIVMSACNENPNTSRSDVLHSNEITSLQVVGGLPRTKGSPLYLSSEKSGMTIISKVVAWINDSTIISGQTEYGKHGYPMVISLRTNEGKTITIEPAYDCISLKNTDGSSSKTCTPVDGEIVLSNESESIRAESKVLYDWLKESWKQE